MSFLREPNAEPISGYRLIEPLGNGGFGEVWKCEAPGGLYKAIKFVYGNLNSLDVEGVRAEQELHALQRIREVRHPFVCSLDRIEVVDGELVIIMELAERTLHDRYVDCQAAGLIGIPRDDLFRYMRDAAEALDYMNEKHNLQHLDVKPRNLFLIGDRVKVADFGLVKHLERQTASGLLGGVTPLYAPPETFNGKISERSDQYSLAIVYMELLTGQRPFTGKNVRQLAQQHMQGQPDLRALPEAERPVIARCLEKDPGKRFPTCMAFLAALYRARTQGRDVAAATTTEEESRPKTMAETMEDISLEGMESLSNSKLAAAVASATNDAEIEADMGMTVAQPETGALRPTLIIGLGSFGRKAMLELRCRFLDRFGDLSKLPLLRFLCIDPDPDAARSAMRGAPEVALARSEVYHLPIQPVVNYRRRMIDQLTEWLPREKLYSIPRSLQPQGCRALGRLAFSDNQQRLLGRLKRDIQDVTHPDVLYQSVTKTGLALRDSTPRVYVIAATGGSSSGLLVDLGFALRRMLSQLRQPDAKVTCFLFAGAPNDPATPKVELANTYATLTEVNHYSDPTVPFSAEYGIDGQRIVDRGTPFNTVYMLPTTNRSPDSLENAVGHLGSYLFHELTTPLGLRLDALREESNPDSQYENLVQMPIRSFGTYAVWFPRGLLMRLAARQALLRIVERWHGGEADVAPEAAAGVQAYVEQTTADPDLRPETLAKKIESSAHANPLTDFGSTPAEALTGLLSNLQEQSLQSVAQEDAVNWARQAVNRVYEWVGAGGEAEQELQEWRKTRLTKLLAGAAHKLAEDFDRKVSDGLFALMEFPGARIITAELAAEQLQSFCHDAAERQREQIELQGVKTNQAWKAVESALQDCHHAGGFRLFGGRSRARQLRNFIDALSHFARQRLSEEIFVAVRQFYSALQARFAERGRDLGFCRQRLRHLQEYLESGPIDVSEELLHRNGDYTVSNSPLPSAESFWESIRQSDTARVVLPEADDDLERSAIRFLQTLTPQQWIELDKEIHERVLIPQQGLHGACMNSGDMTRMLAEPLMEETANILGEHLPIMDVAQILNSEFGISGDLSLGGESLNGEFGTQLGEYLKRAEPLVAGANKSKHQSFLLVPASPAGKTLGQAVNTAQPSLQLVRVPGQADMMFCCEQWGLKLEDLEKLLGPCRNAYELSAANPTTSAHSRFDIVDWVPLDP